jgi:O-antigen/teichoic acid export membrane protein
MNLNLRFEWLEICDKVRAVRADKRMAGVYGNAIRSFAVKLTSIASVFALVPIVIRYINPSEYGIWITISSILAWVNLFDVGLGNGLRSKLTEANALGNERAKAVYFNTTMGLIWCGAVCVFIFFLIGEHWINWGWIINSPGVDKVELHNVVDLAMASLLLQLVIKTVGVAFIAIHKAWLNELMLMLANVGSLIIIFILSQIHDRGTLWQVACIYSITPVVIMTTFYIGSMQKYSWMRPDFSAVQMSCCRELVGTGIKFFLLQVLGLVVFATSNVVIAQLSKPENVTIYNVAYRYFSPVNQLFLMISSPLWGAYTDAIKREDHTWAKSAFKRMGLIFAWTSLFCVILLLVSPIVYHLWVGSLIHIPWGISIPVALYFITCNLVNAATSFLNGILALRLQLILATLIAVLYIPFTLLLNLQLGYSSVCWSVFILNLLSGIILYIQAKRLLYGKASGIWAK